VAPKERHVIEVVWTKAVEESSQVAVAHP